MELAEFVYLLVGFFIGLLLAGVLYVQEKDDDRKRREDAALGAVARPHPSYDDLARTFKGDGTLNWVVHNEFHYSLWLLGERLQYWPTKSKWRWRTVTHTGDVEAFIRVELEEAAEQNPRSTDHE